MHLHVFRLLSTTSNSHDWSLSRDQGDVVVQARTNGEARALAAQAETIALNGDAAFTAQSFGSAFMNPRLYSVHRLGEPPHPPQRPRLLEAQFEPPAQYVRHRD